MKTSKKQIDDFLKSEKVAFVGVSRNKKKFGYLTFKSLVDNGYTIYPVNPHTDKIDDKNCFARVSELPDDVESILIMTPKDKTDEILRESISRGIKNIWVQQMSDTANTMKIAEEYQREIIAGKCIFMFAEPISGIHKFHRMLVIFFGGLPK